MTVGLRRVRAVVSISRGGGSHFSHFSHPAQHSYVGTWSDDDRREVEFYCAASRLLAVGLRSNFSPQMEQLLCGSAEQGDSEVAMASRLDVMTRVNKVHERLGRLTSTEVDVLMAAYDGREVPAAIETVFGPELAPVVMALATPTEMQRMEEAPRLAADAAGALLMAKTAYVRARDGLRVTR